MESPLPDRRVSNSSQTYYKEDNKEEASKAQKGVKISSFKVPFGKIGLTKKINKLEDINLSKRFFYPGAGERRKPRINITKDIKNWTEDILNKLPLIKPKIRFSGLDGSFDYRDKIKAGKNLSEDLSLFREPERKRFHKKDPYCIHKTFYDVLIDLNKRKHENYLKKNELHY